MDDGQQAAPSEPATRKRSPKGKQPSGASQPQSIPLREEVKDALLRVIRAADAPPSAVASASRTLLEFCASDDDRANAAPPAEGLSLEQIDAEIARIGQKARDGV